MRGRSRSCYHPQYPRRRRALSTGATGARPLPRQYRHIPADSRRVRRTRVVGRICASEYRAGYGKEGTMWALCRVVADLNLSLALEVMRAGGQETRVVKCYHFGS